MNTDVLSIEEVCRTLGCKRSRVFELLADGTLERAPRFGRSLRIFKDSVDRALRPPEKRRRATQRRAPADFSAVRERLERRIAERKK